MCELQILELLNEDIDAILPLENELYHKPWQKKDYEYELNDIVILENVLDF